MCEKFVVNTELNKYQRDMGCRYRQNSAIVTFVNGASNFVYGAFVFINGASVFVNGAFVFVNGAFNFVNGAPIFSVLVKLVPIS